MNTEIQNQFFPYEISKKLKELGFNESCLAKYTKGELFWHPISGSTIENSFLSRSVAAPLWQQCLDYLRTEKGIYIYINPFNEVLNHRKAILFKWAILNHSVAKEFSTFEVAREQSILKALELIEKQK